PVAFILIIHMGVLSLFGDIFFVRFYALFMGRMQGLNVCLKLLSRKPPQLVICFRSWGAYACPPSCETVRLLSIATSRDSGGSELSVTIAVGSGSVGWVGCLRIAMNGCSTYR